MMLAGRNWSELADRCWLLRDQLIVCIQKLVVAQLLIILPVVRHCNHKSPPPVPVPPLSNAVTLK
jgi:hypothetical protein